MKVVVYTIHDEIIDIEFDDSDKVFHDVVDVADDIKLLTIGEIGSDQEFNIVLDDVRFWVYCNDD